MKLLKLLTILLFGLTSICRAQESAKYLKLKKTPEYRTGYVLTHDSVTIQGLIKRNFNNKASNYSIVKFVHTDGSKEKYYPSNILSFGYSYRKFVSDKLSFYEIIHSGKNVTLYKNVSSSSWSTPGAPGMGSTTYYSTNENFYVKRDCERTFTKVRKKRFKEDFSAYFNDCESIRTQILEDQVTYKDIKTIVRNYNACVLNL